MRHLTWETIAVLAIILIAGGVLLLLFQVLTLRAVAWLVRKDVARLSAGRRVRRRSLTANYLGQESLGRAQIHGNGALLLTERELIFVLAAPRRELEVPLSRVTGATLTHRHLGRRSLRPLLRVEWRGEQGTDAAAWGVRDAEGWLRDLEELRRRQGP